VILLFDPGSWRVLGGAFGGALGSSRGECLIGVIVTGGIRLLVLISNDYQYR